MRKNILFPAMIVLVIIACTILISDGLTYLISSLMALVIMVTIRGNRLWVMKVTRWAKANNRKAQVLITFLQLILMTSGISAGYNFKKLGYELSNTTAFVFSTIIVICFLSVPFLPKRRAIAIPKEVNKHRSAFIGIALSSFVMMVLFGNRIGDIYPNSLITQAVEAIDQAVFPDNSTQYAYANDAASEPAHNENNDHALIDEPSDLVVFASFTSRDKPTALEKKVSRLEKKHLKMMKSIEKYRLAYGAGIIAVSVLLMIFILIPLLCAGICLIILGISGEISAGYILLGALVTAGSIWGMKKLFQWNKRKRNNSSKP